MEQLYSVTGIKSKIVTSNKPLSVNLILGITGNVKKDNVKNGLKPEIAAIAVLVPHEGKLNSETTSCAWTSSD